MKLACVIALTFVGATMPVLAEKKIIQPKEFDPGAAFSPAVLVDGTLYVSGQNRTRSQNPKSAPGF